MYLDVMGYEAVIKKNDSKKLEALLGIIRRFALTQSNYQASHDLVEGGHVTQCMPEISSFSDLVVLSVPLYCIQQFNVLEMMTDFAARYCLDCLGGGFLVRGAITSGNLIHHKEKTVYRDRIQETTNIVFGEALVEAVKLEKDKNHPNPTITISPATIKLFELTAPDHLKILKQDVDGSFYIDWVGSPQFNHAARIRRMSSKEAIDHFREKIDKELQALETDPKAHMKWLWMKNYFTEEAKKYL